MKGRVREAIVGLAASGSAAVLLSLRPAGGLGAPTALLAALPALAGSARWLDAFGAGFGGRPLDPAVWRTEGLALGALAGGLLAAPRIGIRPEVPVAGLALLLLVHACLQALSWRRSLGARGERCPPSYLLLALGVYVAALVWTHPQRAPDGDAPWFLLLAHSLIEDGDVDLADEYADGVGERIVGRAVGPQPGDPVGDEGQRWSRHGPVLPALLAVPLAVGGVLGARLLILLAAALLAWRTLALSLRAGLAPPGVVLLAWSAFAFAPPVLVYSSLVWVEIPAALALVVALEAAGRRKAVFVGALVFLPLLKLRLAPVALGALLASGRRRGGLKRGALGLGVALAVLFVSYRMWLGNALGLHRPEELVEAFARPGRAALGLLGIVVDSSFGLLPAAPLWALAFVGLAVAARQRPATVIDAALVGLPYLLLLAPRIEWFGGWSPPFRYPLVLLPVGVPFLAAGIHALRRSRARWSITTLAVVTLLLAALWVAQPGQAWNFADGRSHLLDTASLHLRADVARFFPSTVRPRAATWVWLGVLLLLPLARRLPGPKTARASVTVGLTVALGLAVTVPLAATRFPTRIAEVEDPWILHRGGGLAPERWWPQRVLQPGGWLLERGSHVEIPAVAGGERAEIRIRATAIGGPALVEVRVGEGTPARLRIAAERWSEFDAGVHTWSTGSTLSLLPIEEDAADGTPIVDRVEIDWR